MKFPTLFSATLVAAMTVGISGCNSSTKAVSPTGVKDSAEAPVAALPDNLKSEGYSYYGLGYAEPMNMEVQASTNPAIQTGTQITKLKEVKDGKAVFAIERTGNLGELLGNMEVSLEPDGVYVKSSSIADFGNRDLELPAQMTAGKEWSTKTVVNNAKQKMDVSNSFKIIGAEKVTTPVGSYDSILVTSTGVGTMNGQNIRMETKGWYVKDRGMVKAVLTNTDASGTKSVITIQEAR
jgi:hypothetical protein